MPRARRIAPPRTLHHVVNRGVGRRPIFETERDVRAFLALIALAVRAGLIELHAFTVLATHYHLVVRVCDGTLSDTMQWIQDLYARWFNRTRGRDGHVFQGRFTSRLIEDAVYYVTVVSYIDQNACEAGIATDPRAYPHGSARWYATLQGPRWLHRELVEGHVRDLSRSPRYRVEDYSVLWKTCAGWGGGELAARQLATRGIRTARVHDLTRAGPERVQHWLRQNALNEAGSPVACLLLPVQTAMRLIAELRPPHDPDAASGTSSQVAPQAHLAVGLLRSGCGLRLEEIAAHLRMSTATAGRCLAKHASQVRADGGYLAAFAEWVHAGLRLAYGAMTVTPLPDLAQDIRARQGRRGVRKMGQTPGRSGSARDQLGTS